MDIDLEALADNSKCVCGHYHLADPHLKYLHYYDSLPPNEQASYRKAFKVHLAKTP